MRGGTSTVNKANLRVPVAGSFYQGRGSQRWALPEVAGAAEESGRLSSREERAIDSIHSIDSIRLIR